MKRIFIKIAKGIIPIIIIIGMLSIFSKLRYLEKPTAEEEKIIDNFYLSGNKQ